MNNKSFSVRNAGAIGLAAALLVGLYLTSRHSYLLFHSLIELFTIVVAGGIFVIAWNARGYIHNNYLLFIAIASLFVAVLDLLHTLAYEGMGVFRGDTANLATQLWVAGRYLQSVSWLAAPLLLGRKFKPAVQIGAYAAVTTGLLLSIFQWQVFPTAYVTGEGLTAFKRTSEYIISLMFVVGIVLLVLKRDQFDARVWPLVAMSLGLTIGAELAFTAYISVYGEANLIGHLLRWLASYFLYKAIIETGLVTPYALLLHDLKRTEDRLRDYASRLQARNEELVRTENRLREDGASLKARNEELDAYAHTVAHDLKNPLTIIIAAADLVSVVRDLSAAELGQNLRQIKATAYEMNDIIDNLLKLAEVRKVDASLEPVEMGMTVAAAEKRLAQQFQQTGGRLIKPASWPVAMGYGPWIEEVWANYISNALKYGGPSPAVEVGADPASNGQIRFWTRDHGAGVPATARASLFTPFTQLGNKHQAGHGLGLSIVLRIVQKLGGQVGVESETGQGSTFYFTLPAVPAVAEQPHPGIPWSQGQAEPTIAD